MPDPQWKHLPEAVRIPIPRGGERSPPAGRGINGITCGEKIR